MRSCLGGIRAACFPSIPLSSGILPPSLPQALFSDKANNKTLSAMDPGRMMPGKAAPEPFSFK